MEHKTTPVEFKASKEPGRYAGYFSVFGNIDDGGDIIHQGAFSKTIAERRNRIKLFYAHDWEKLIGPPPDMLSEDDRGLYAEGRLTLESFWGKEVWALMSDNALNEGSIGYETVAGKTDYTDDGVRNIREAKLYEISPVPLGMNPLTAVNAVKAGALKPDAAYAAFLAIIDEIKAGRVLSSANADRVRSALTAVESLAEVLNELLAAAEPEPGKAAPHSALLERRLRAAKLALSFMQN
ncbi:MAG: HK97 family phage prohead protease [Anaerolineae bacterium]|nr:HK97 family phage prohead protease [Anaerolineae bacterium]